MYKAQDILGRAEKHTIKALRPVIKNTKIVPRLAKPGVQNLGQVTYFQLKHELKVKRNKAQEKTGPSIHIPLIKQRSLTDQSSSSCVV